MLQVFAEQVEFFVSSDEIVPDLQLNDFSFSSWSEISQVCGDSRVWGGMHFQVSPAHHGVTSTVHRWTVYPPAPF